MKRPKVSVIVPVYNTATYLEEAMDSIVNQTLKDIEVIVINDGSTDNSMDILTGYEDRLNLLILQKSNNGQASARNDGLDMAAGDYIYFLDSDDWIEPDTLQTCVDICDRDNLDFAYFNAVSFHDKDGSVIDGIQWLDYHRTPGDHSITTGAETLLHMLQADKYRSSVCMSMFRRTFLTKNCIRFREGIIHEDELFSAIAYFNAEKVEGIDREFYHRRVHDDSTMTRTFSKKNVDGYLTVTHDMRRFTRNNKDCQSAVHYLTNAIMLTLMQNGWVLPFSQKLRIAGTVLFRYPRSFRFRPFMTLLFKRK